MFISPLSVAQISSDLRWVECEGSFKYEESNEMRNFSRHSRQIPYPHPCTFAGLMEVYETNYIHIRNLLGDVRSGTDVYRIEFDAAPAVWVRVFERTKYTATLNMRYAQMEGMCAEEIPDIDVKIYFDALQAEVNALSRSGSSRSGDRVCPQVDPLLANLDKRWKANRFLYKWLAYCVRKKTRIVCVRQLRD